MKKTALAALLIIILTLAGCFFMNHSQTGDDSRKLSSEEFFAMDTVMKISAYGSGAENSLAKARKEIERLESLWSVSLPDSEISRANTSGKVNASPDTRRIIETAVSVSSETGNTFDITIYPVVKAWGFTTGEYRIPDEMELAKLKNLVSSARVSFDGETVILGEGMALDLGAIAKGYASEKAASMLREDGITSAVLSLGGNVQVLGTKPDGSPWNVAVQDPAEPNEYAGAVRAADTAIVTSGVYQRYFEKDGALYHHLIDPSTGKPADNGLLSVTIVTKSGTLADALSTAVFIMGEDAAIDFWRSGVYDFEMIFIKEGGDISITEGLDGTFTPLGADRRVSIISR